MRTTPVPTPASTGRVRALFAGPVRSLRSPRAPGDPPTAWKSAILKAPLDAAVMVTPLGLAGDAQKERRHHGGPTKAVLVYSTQHYVARWDAALGAHAAMHAVPLRAMSPDIDASRFGFGAFGENLAVDGPDEHTVFLGDLWRIGECVLQITEPRGPCATLCRRWMRPALLDEVKTSAAAGWYNAVHTTGPVAPGDAMTLVSRMQVEWSLARVFDLLEQPVVSRADVRALHDAPCTHDGLRARLARRLATAGRTHA